MKVTVAIVAPIHNRRETTLQCLRSLARISQESVEIRTYIVDDGSSDGSSEGIRSEFPSVTVVQGSGHLWYTEGTNVGIRAALVDDPDFVLAINDDSVFDVGFLNHLVETATRHPRSVVGPLLLRWDKPHKLFQTAPIWRTLKGGWLHWQQQTVWTVPSAPWEVDLIVGNCVLYPASAFEECGLMDSRRFPNFGDAEFTPRLKRAGYKLIVDPRSRVFCQPNAVPLRLRSQSVSQLFRGLVLDLKHPANLPRLFLSYLSAGPSAAQGAAAFLIFLVRSAVQALGSRESHPVRHREPPLSEVFARYVLDQE